jgi:hypothetical protein
LARANLSSQEAPKIALREIQETARRSR